MQQLLEKLVGDKERVGFILTTGEIIEVANVCNDPCNGFEVSADDIEKYDNENLAASWHTHPGKDANLSLEDYYTFRLWPHLIHYIVGSDGVRCYKVVNDRVVPHEA